MDLVADVLLQADKMKLKIAASKLTGNEKKTVAKAPSTDFQKLSESHSSKRIQTATRTEFKKDQSKLPGDGTQSTELAPASREARRKEAMQGLETVLATKMVEAMMPKDQSELYGEGTAGEIWRGFHIDSMGKALASQRLLSTSADDVKSTKIDTQGTGRTKMIVPFAG